MMIRPARAEDAPAIAEIWNYNIRQTANTFTTVEKTAEGLADDIAARQVEGRAFLVAEDGEQAVGFATYFPFRSGPGYAHTAEHSVMLNEARKGLGIGRALVTALEEHARKSGVHVFIAAVSSENPNAIAFYKAIGYAQVATMPELGRKFDRWMDLILLQKRL
ncbi:GNAT family N-acetyltransferase [Roseovarius sp. 2305UL8-3]|uniref:GNAT family N-acetyltransferase n=1 Tax=Roseovarius conchicola TaxID=3121636 RepID=UPI003526C88F